MPPRTAAAADRTSSRASRPPAHPRNTQRQRTRATRHDAPSRQGSRVPEETPTIARARRKELQLEAPPPHIMAAIFNDKYRWIGIAMGIPVNPASSRTTPAPRPPTPPRSPSPPLPPPSPPPPKEKPTLLTVPYEIRIEIFRGLLVVDTPIPVYYGWRKVYERRRPALSLGILLICRQIYLEAKLVLYGHNEFLYHIRDANTPWTCQQAVISSIQASGRFNHTMASDDEDSSWDSDEENHHFRSLEPRKAGKSPRNNPPSSCASSPPFSQRSGLIDVQTLAPLFHYITIAVDANRADAAHRSAIAAAIDVFGADRGSGEDKPNIYVVTIVVTPRVTGQWVDKSKPGGKSYNISFVNFFDDSSPIIKSLSQLSCQLIRVRVKTHDLLSHPSNCDTGFDIDINQKPAARVQRKRDGQQEMLEGDELAQAAIETKAREMQDRFENLSFLLETGCIDAIANQDVDSMFNIELRGGPPPLGGFYGTVTDEEAMEELLQLPYGDEEDDDLLFLPANNYIAIPELEDIHNDEEVAQVESLGISDADLKDAIETANNSYNMGLGGLFNHQEDELAQLEVSEEDLEAAFEEATRRPTVAPESPTRSEPPPQQPDATVTEDQPMTGLELEAPSKPAAVAVDDDSDDDDEEMEDVVYHGPSTDLPQKTPGIETTDPHTRQACAEPEVGKGSSENGSTWDSNPFATIPELAAPSSPDDLTQLLQQESNIWNDGV